MDLPLVPDHLIFEVDLVSFQKCLHQNTGKNHPITLTRFKQASSPFCWRACLKLWAWVIVWFPPPLPAREIYTNCCLEVLSNRHLPHQCHWELSGDKFCQAEPNWIIKNTSKLLFNTADYVVKQINKSSQELSPGLALPEAVPLPLPHLLIPLPGF